MGRRKNKGDETKREILGILIMAFALLVFLGLVSHNPADYPNSGSIRVIKNWLGLAGAWISYYLFVYTIGYSCLILPFLFFLLGWNIFLHRNLKPFFRLGLYLLALGLFLSTALALPQAVSESGSPFGFRLSGNLGGFFATQLYHYLGTAGSIVVLLTFLLLFLVSTTSWSMREAILGFRDEVAALFQAIQKQSSKLKQSRPGRKVKKVSTPIAFREPAIEKVAEQPEKPSVVCIPSQQSGMPVDERRLPQPKEKSAPPKTQPSSAIAQPQREYRLPTTDLLDVGDSADRQFDRRALEEKAHFLEERLLEFDVKSSVVGIQPGPVITRFEVKPAPGVKVSRFVSCQDDLALVMQASRVRVVAPIPGKAAVGIEIPNREPSLVTLRSILESGPFRKPATELLLALGRTIEGQPYVTDLTELPHLLVAGATGSGKSVCLNTIITSILYRAKPDEVKLILIDPKKLELALYRNLRHYHLTTREDLNEEVITTVENAVSMLRSLEREMDGRYRLLAKAGVRNIHDYNSAVSEGRLSSPDPDKSYQKLPYLVLIVDELADLMITGARDIEEPIARLAQMSRAVGIHLILATQRPSVDVITGVIKANFPSRIAFQVTSKTDSRTILDRNGAEKLLGRGDMLFLHPREPEPIRIHGAFVSTEEVKRIMGHIIQQPRGELLKLKGPASGESGRQSGRAGGERDELFREAARLIIRHQQGSASLLQRRLRIGYARAGRLIDEMEDMGILGPFDGSKAREVLVDESFLEKLDDPGFLAGDNDEDTA